MASMRPNETDIGNGTDVYLLLRRHPLWWTSLNALNIIQTICAFLIIACNSLTLWCFIRHNFLKKKMNIFLVNLCISDLLGGLGGVVMFFANYLALIPGGLPSAPCMALGFFLLLTFSSSLLSVTGATFETYLMIANPLTHLQYADSPIHFLGGVLVWVFCILVSALTMIGNDYQPGFRSCKVKNFTGPIQGTLLWLPFVLTQLVVVGVLFVKILRIARRQRRAIADQAVLPQADNQQKAEGQANRRRANLIISIIVVLYAAWIPFILFVAVRRFTSPQTMMSPPLIFTESFVELLVFINSLLNPVLYQRFSPDIKRAYVRSFGLADNAVNHQLELY